jgi:quercetin dioxygenase-like cupin family protein
MSFFNVDQLYVRHVADGVKLRIIAGEKMMMAFFYMQPDAVLPEHAHPHEQMGTVLEGALEVTIGGHKQVVGPGEAYHIAANLAHSGRCLDQPARVLEMFAPPREDFLKL